MQQLEIIFHNYTDYKITKLQIKSILPYHKGKTNFSKIIENILILKGKELRVNVNLAVEGEENKIINSAELQYKDGSSFFFPSAECKNLHPLTRNSEIHITYYNKKIELPIIENEDSPPEDKDKDIDEIVQEIQSNSNKTSGSNLQNSKKSIFIIKIAKMDKVTKSKKKNNKSIKDTGDMKTTNAIEDLKKTTPVLSLEQLTQRMLDQT